MEPVIELRDVSFTYGEQLVLEKISLRVQKGDFLALIGPNGSGKTTLVKLTLGLLKPLEGEILLFGTQISKFKAWYRIGYVPQRPGLENNFPATVEEVVAVGRFARAGLGRRLRREDWRAVGEVLELMEISTLRHRPLVSLSGGQQQRTFVARALVSQPDALILDEPQTGLDSRTLHDFYHLLKDLNQDKKITLLMVSHDIGAVTCWVNEVVCLNRTLICHGKPRDLLIPDTLSQLYGTEVRAVVHGH